MNAHAHAYARVHVKKRKKIKKQRHLAFLAHILKFYLKIQVLEDS